MLDAIASPSWMVAFAVALAVLLFVIKFVVAREPKFDDIVIAAAEIPAEISAACISLLIASFSFAGNWRQPAGLIILVIFVFIGNVIVLRLVERDRRNLSGSIWNVSLLIALSAAFCITVCFNAVSSLYLAGGN